MQDKLAVGALVVWVLPALFSCGGGSDTSPGSAGSAAQTSAGTGFSMGGVNAQGGSGAGVSAGGSAGASAGSGADFAQCGQHQPGGTCSKDALCLSVSCGMLTSQLSSDGCLRATCTADADCANDELCFPGPVVAQVDATTPRFAPSCQANGTRCDCTGATLDSGAKAYCAPKADVFAGFGCLPRASIRNDCTKLASWISGAQALLGSLSLEQTVATTAQSCITDAMDYHQQHCP
jgi:hypothetical protein